MTWYEIVRMSDLEVVVSTSSYEAFVAVQALFDPAKYLFITHSWGV